MGHCTANRARHGQGYNNGETKSLPISNLILDAPLSDILLAGFVDENDDPLRFFPTLTTIYLVLGTQILVLEATETTGTLRLSLTETTEPTLVLDDGMRFALSSARELVLRDPDRNHTIRAAHLWALSKEGESIRCAAMKLDLSDGQILFFDPTYHFGIRIGGIEQEQDWLKSWPGAGELAAYSIDRT